MRAISFVAWHQVDPDSPVAEGIHFIGSRCPGANDSRTARVGPEFDDSLTSIKGWLKAHDFVTIGCVIAERYFSQNGSTPALVPSFKSNKRQVRIGLRTIEEPRP